MDDRHTLSAVVLQFALACDLCTLVYLTTLLNGPVGLWYPHMLLVCAPAVYGLNRLFLRRSRTVRSMVLFNGALWTDEEGNRMEKGVTAIGISLKADYGAVTAVDRPDSYYR